MKNLNPLVRIANMIAEIRMWMVNCILDFSVSETKESLWFKEKYSKNYDQYQSFFV
jgi:hypothetical protein